MSEELDSAIHWLALFMHLFKRTNQEKYFSSSALLLQGVNTDSKIHLFEWQTIKKIDTVTVPIKWNHIFVFFLLFFSYFSWNEIQDLNKRSSLIFILICICIPWMDFEKSLWIKVCLLCDFDVCSKSVMLLLVRKRGNEEME